MASSKNHELKILKDYIGRLPYKNESVSVEAVSNGEKAWEQIEFLYQRRQNIDLIVSAEDMDNVTGTELTKMIRSDKRYHDIPVILFASEVTKELAAKAREYGVRACIVQPFGFQNFYDSLTRIVDEDIAQKEEDRKNNLIHLFEETTYELDEKLKKVYSKSMEQIRTILRLAPWSGFGQVSIAKIHCGRNKFELALPILKNVIMDNFKMKEAHDLLMLCYKRLGKAFEDTSELDLRVKGNPNSASLNQLLGESLLRDGDFLRAAKYFKKAIELHKKHDSPRLKAKSHVGLGESQMTQADEENKPELRDEAVDNFKAGRQIDPQLMSAYFNLVTVYRKMGNEDMARQTYQEMLNIAPETAEDWMTMFETYLAEGDINKAKYSIHKALELAPDDQTITITAGKKYMRQEMYDDALEMFEKTKNINPSDLRIYNYLGICLRRLSKHGEALAAYTKALEINPSDPSIYFNMGRALESLDRKPEAIKHYKEALRLDPELDMASEFIEKLSDDAQKEPPS